MGEWFETWFDTDYYHALYNNRNEQEAARFIENLVSTLKIPQGASVLDLACGGGRHSAQLFQLGFDVTGLDLSSNSIELARKNYSSDIRFDVADMRTFESEKPFDFVFNLFTSFGYFDSTDDNELVLSQIKKTLKPGGILVIDFMNAEKVLGNLVPAETQKRGELIFNIKRSCDGSHFYKDIVVIDGEKTSHFQEKVQYLDIHDFTRLLNTTGFEIERTFGNYNLDGFDSSKSDRLIMVACLKS